MTIYVQRMNCPLCDRVALCREGKDAGLIREFKHSFLVLGDHQTFPGYSVLVLKNHERELHDLSPEVQAGIFQELMLAGKAIADEFRPWKMNYSCYGNQVPHVHWHLFPRYESDPRKLEVPWNQSASFGLHRVSAEEARRLIERIRSRL